MSLFGYNLIPDSALEYLEQRSVLYGVLEEELAQTKCGEQVLLAHLEAEKLTNKRLRAELAQRTKDAFAYSEILDVVSRYAANQEF